MGPFLVVMQSSVKMPPWIQEDQSSEEAEGPETDSIPFQLFFGENWLNGCLCVKVQESMLSKWIFLRNPTECQVSLASMVSFS